MSLLLSCQSIGKAYGAAPLFEDLSFGLFEGDRIGLVGPNGSGKSTLLKILAGLETPDRGTRSVRKLLRLGYVPQDASFDPERTVEEIVAASLEADLAEAGERDARVAATLGKVGFADPHERTATLSGGWTKRLAVACALVGGPDLLLMDEARIQDAAQLQVELEAVQTRTATRAVGLEFSASERKTKRLLTAKGIEKRFGGRSLFAPLSLTLSPGTRLGLLGPNGSGKTTLLRLLAGEIEADAGTIETADDLRLLYLDQHREQIDPSVTLRRALAPEGDQVVYRDRPLHVASWARRFLFPAEQLDMPVGRLSGGERARVAIARLMLRPADVLIVDEPTNDLDIPTLEVLEESLLDFPGAVVLVTHDRYLFERVATVVLALDGSGGAQFFADYQQWEESQRRPAASARTEAAPRSAAAKSAPKGLKRLSYNDRREWAEMEATILAAEEALEACRHAAADPTIAADAAALERRYAEVQAAQERVERLYARWAELEAVVLRE